MKRAGAGGVLLLVQLCLWSPAALGAAAPAAAPKHKLPVYVPLEEKVETRLVLVPVSVLDRSRHPVQGLRASDFELQVDGAPRRIVSFDPPLLNNPTPPPAVRSSTQPKAAKPKLSGLDRTGSENLTSRALGQAAKGKTSAGSSVPRVHIALVLDLFQTRPQRITSGIHALRQALGQGLPARTDAALFVISHGRPVTVQPFTQETGRILQALENMAANPSLRDDWLQAEKSREDAVRDYIPHEIGATASTTQATPFLTATENRKKGLDSGPGQGPGMGDLLLPFDAKQSAEAAVRSYSIAQAQRNTHLLEALTSLAAALSRLPGRKSVVLVGDGFREQAGTNYALGQNFLMDKTTSLRKEFQQMVRLYQRAGVTLSPVSLLGLYHPRPADPQGLDEIMGSMQFLSEATGGRPPVPLNGFAAEIAAGLSQPSFSYVLGFRPQPDQSPGTVHAIHVRLRRPHLTLTARSEYVDLSRASFDSRTRAAGALLLPEQYQELGLSLQAHLVPGPGDRPEINLQMELPTAAVAWLAHGDRRRRGKLRVQGFLRDATGRVEELFDDLYPLDVDAWKPPSRIVIQESQQSAVPRNSRLVAVVLDGISGKIGTASVSIPPWKGSGGEVEISTPVLLPEAKETYLLSPDGEPLLGFRQGTRLFLPSSAADQGAGLVLAQVRIAGLPEAGQVRFCMEQGGDRCVTARLRQEDQPAGQDTIPLWSAWVALDQDSIPQAAALRVEVLDGTDRVVASSGGASAR